MSRLESCGPCTGSGIKSGTSATTCGTCGGSGQVVQAVRTPLGVFQQVHSYANPLSLEGRGQSGPMAALWGDLGDVFAECGRSYTGCFSTVPAIPLLLRIDNMHGQVSWLGWAKGRSVPPLAIVPEAAQDFLQRQHSLRGLWLLSHTNMLSMLMVVSVESWVE